MRLRILEVLEPGADGVFRHVEGLCRHLLAAGHRVDLAYSSVRGSDRLDLLVRDVAAAGGLTLDLCTGNAPSWPDFGAFRRLRRMIRQGKPMVIHAHSSKAGALTRLLRAVGVRQPLVYTPHAYYGMGRDGGKRAAFFNSVERGLSRVGWTIHVSDDESEWAHGVLRLPASRCRVIPNSVDTSVFTPGTAADRGQWRRELGWAPDAVVLGTVGRLSPQKDPVTLYRAVGGLMATEPRLHLLHVGQGELAPVLEAIIREFQMSGRVRRLDYLSDTAGFYRGVDAFASTSTYEGLPIAVLEAMAADLPLLLSDAPGNRGFMKLGLSHLLTAPAGDAGRWSEVIRRWLRDRSGRETESMGPSNHRVIAESKFSHEAGYGRVLEFYAELVKGGP